MAYHFFDNAHPDYTTDDGQAFGETIRQNEAALRDAIVLASMPFFNIYVYGDDLEQPDYYIAKSGQIWIKKTPTYDGEGEITAVLYEISKDGGTSWDTIGTVTITADAQGNFQQSEWS